MTIWNLSECQERSSVSVSMVETSAILELPSGHGLLTSIDFIKPSGHFQMWSNVCPLVWIKLEIWRMGFSSGAWVGILNLPRGCERSQFYAWLRPFWTIAILIERWLKTMLSLDWSRLVSFLQPLPLSHRDKSNWLVGFQSAKKVKSHCRTVDDTCSYATSCIFHFLFSSQDILSFFIFFHLPWRLQHFYSFHGSQFPVPVQGAWAGDRHTRSLETGRPRRDSVKLQDVTAMISNNRWINMEWT